MGNTPSRAAEGLAEEATAAGWPTTPSQVEELTKRKVLPAAVVTRRGRGITTSEYPPGSLDVLVAMRRASAQKGFRPHRRAVVLAWCWGAAIRDEGLRPALLASIEEVHSAIAGGIRRRHRRDHTDTVPNPTDRALVLDAVAGALLGRKTPSALAAFAVETLRPMVDPVLSAVSNKVGVDASALPVPVDLQTELVRVVAGRDPDTGSEAIDLTLTGARAFVASAPRELLDTGRDIASRMLGAAATDPENADLLVGIVVGTLPGMSAYDDYCRRRGGIGLAERFRRAGDPTESPGKAPRTGVVT